MMYRCTKCDKTHHETEECGRYRNNTWEKEYSNNNWHKNNSVKNFLMTNKDMNLKMKSSWILDSGSTSHM